MHERVNSTEHRIKIKSNPLLCVKSKPLIKERDLRVTLKEMPPLINDSSCDGNPILNIRRSKVKISKSLIPRNESMVLAIANAITPLNALAVMFMKPLLSSSNPSNYQMLE